MSDAEDSIDMHGRVARLDIRVSGLEAAIPIYQEAITRLIEQVEDLNRRLKAVERATPLAPPKRGKPPRQRPLFESELPHPEDPRWRL